MSADRRLPLTQHELDSKVCLVHPDKPIELIAKCHPDIEGVRVYYSGITGCLQIVCIVCDRVIAEIEVAL